MGGTSGEPPKVGEGWMRINDAGVAGATPWLDCLFRWASMAGDCVTEVGLGGGPMSDKGSGEIESVPELSRPRGTSNPLQDNMEDRSLCAPSTNSLTSFGGTREVTVAFRRFGFTMGDCRTRLVAFDERGALRLLLRSLLPCSGCAIADSGSRSMSTSMGDVPVELPEVV